ncbi:unnamed protein product [Tetraodon nigroviridis]|uniref:(spotted green pufferfish) hypothetical protein n=1 Tax=Tetraodon nigroviridis TaxID=99883 RepID=Q4RLG0_TETNG|nr:unnamed protein product [Tetraodon nigroviridis]
MKAIVSSLNATIQELTKLCPPCWTPYRGKCYLRSTSQRSWEDSRKFCQDQDADLVVVSDLDKQRFITSTFAPNFWIGVSLERKPSKIWKGVNGEEITTTFWATGEPNDSLEMENCVVSLSCCSEKSWNDALCGKPEFCVCEKRMQ